jgi:hypothetical protein
MVGTWLNELRVDTGLVPGDVNKDGKYDCAGFFGNTCGTPSPEWRHKLRAGFTFKSGIAFRPGSVTSARSISTSVRRLRSWQELRCHSGCLRALVN